MGDPQELLAQRMRDAAAAAFGAEHEGDDPLIRPSAFADFQSNMALPLAKRLHQPPRDVAQQLASHVDVAGICDAVEVSGPGFINFTLARAWIAGQATGQL